MALSQPIVYKISAFDALNVNSNVFRIGQTNSDTVSIAQVNIYNNISGIIEFTSDTIALTRESTSTIALQTYTFVLGIVPNGILKNNSKYYMTVKVKTNTASPTWSPLSNGNLFACYSTPTFTFPTIQAQYIQSNIRIQMQYNQEQNELLNYYTMELHGIENSIEAQDVNLTPSPTKFYDSNYDFIFNDLSNTYNATTAPKATYKEYYIKGSGVTVNGTNFSNNSSKFTVKYIEQVNSPLIKVTNNCTEGYIKVESNITNIQGIAVPSNVGIPTTPPYEDVNLTASLFWNIAYSPLNWNEPNTIDVFWNDEILGEYIIWDDGYDINSPIYAIEIWVRQLSLWQLFSIREGEKLIGNYLKYRYKTTLQYIEDEDIVGNIRIGMLVNKKIFEFINSNFIETGEQNYYIESNSIPKPINTNWLYIGVQKNESIYNINLINKLNTL